MFPNSEGSSLASIALRPRLLQPACNSHAPCVLPACVEQRTRVLMLSVRPRIHLLTRLVRFGRCSSLRR